MESNLNLELNQLLRLRLYKKVVARLTCGDQQEAAQ